MKAKKSVTLILLLLLASCSSSSSRSDEVLYQKISEANELVIAVDKAIYLADSDPTSAVISLWDLCEQAEAFTQSIYGTPPSNNKYASRYKQGWEYPGDVPSDYDDALWTPIYACYLHDVIKEGQISTAAEYIAQFRVGYRCIRSGICGG